MADAADEKTDNLEAANLVEAAGLEAASIVASIMEESKLEAANAAAATRVKLADMEVANVKVPSKEAAKGLEPASLEAFKVMVEAEMADFVQKSQPQAEVAAPLQSASPLRSHSRSRKPTGTPRTPTMQTRGVTAAPRASSADSKRPYGKSLENSTASLRQSRAAQPLSSSLWRAASLTKRTSHVWDPHQAFNPDNSVSKDAAGAEGHHASSCPSTPLQTRRPRLSGTSTVSGGGVSTPRTKARAKPSTNVAFGRAAVGHTPRSPRDVGAALREDEPSTEASTVPAAVATTEKELERVRTARAVMAMQRQRELEAEKARLEEQRRRAAVVRDRARVDREAARIAARTFRPSSVIDPEALESAWVSS